jgi:hypothetical protein
VPLPEPARHRLDRKVYLVVDRHSAHRSRKVRAWLADLKRSLPMHSRARDQAQLAAETRTFFHRRPRQPHIVRGRRSRYILE